MRAVSEKQYADNITSQQNLLEVLDRRAVEMPHKKAFGFINDEGDEHTITYQKLVAECRLIAATLQEKGYSEKTILLFFPSGLEFIKSFFACLYAGAVAVPAYPPKANSSFERIESILMSSPMDAILATEETCQAIREKETLSKKLASLTWLSLETLQGDSAGKLTPQQHDIAYVQYTSGSTSAPKGATISHKNIMHNLEMIKIGFDLSSDDIFMGWMPLFHDMGLVGQILIAPYVGATTYIISPANFMRSPVTLLKAFTKYKATVIGGPNFSYDKLANITEEKELEAIDLSTLRVACNGAEPISYETIRNFSTKFIPYGFKPEAFLPCYGMAEATLMISGLISSDLKFLTLDNEQFAKKQIMLPSKTTKKRKTLVSSGPVLPGQTLKIISSETQSVLGENEVGEIWVTGDHVCKGYWQRPDVTKEMFCELEGKYYLKTGDLGFIHKDELFVTGRLKDMLIVRGENFYPKDIEQMVESCSEAIVQNSCGVAQHPQNFSISVVLEIERSHIKKIDFEALTQDIRKKIASHFGISFDVVCLLKPFQTPKTSSGKIQRSRLPQFVMEGPEKAFLYRSDRASYVPAQANIVDAAVKGTKERLLTLAKKVNIDGYQHWNTPLIKLGVDSAAMLEMQMLLEKEFSLKVEVDEIIAGASLEDIYKRINGKNPQQFTKETSSSLLSESALEKLFDALPQKNLVVTEQSGRDLEIGDKKAVDFASCNYLGFDYDPDIINSVAPMIKEWGTHPSWTRAVASPEPYALLEKELATLVKAPDTVVFPNVAMLNFGVIPLILGKSGAVFCDYEAHHTIQEACELASSRGAAFVKYRYNDFAELEAKLGSPDYKNLSPKLITIDGVYSMSVGYADIPKYIEIAKKHDAYLFIDDAHGFGIIGESPTKENPYGEKGNGIVNYFGRDYARDRILYVAGLSKAYSSHAAFITCHDAKMKARFQMANTYIFSGPVPVATLATALKGIEINASSGEEKRQHIFHLSKKLVNGARDIGFEVDNTGYFPIVFVVIGGIEQTMKACQIAWDYGLVLTPGVYPAVPINRGGLRFSITALNTEKHIDILLQLLQSIKSEL